MRHQRGRNGVFNFVALELSGADGDNLSVDADASGRVGHEQQVTAAPFDELNKPAIEFGKRRVSQVVELSMEIALWD